ncbi:hypothetical protein SLOPH_2382 [Spraguea lophii 42_110]|uniref:Uncharacterized protein n=1 Tax=Spraguea lophii (strain 42_110) TaxID=1358809 RepID=S7WDH0_SPRLO|nr:hypothetical protein SLOPH_2382 [Spraguea lophii 42_110]
MNYQQTIYDTSNKLPVIHNNIKNSNAVILLSGMGGDMLSPDYQHLIMSFCTKNNIFCISPKLQSYPDFGLYTLDDDISDIKKLIEFFELKNIFLIGHSTGCQISIYLLNNSNIKIHTIILQGPVSDRECTEKYNNNLKNEIAIAQKTTGILPFLYEGVEIKSERFLDLVLPNGKDDLFSSDLPDIFFYNLNKKNTKIVIINSIYDEFTVNDNKYKLKLINNNIIYDIESNHSCESNDGNTKLLDIVSKYLKDFKNSYLQ